MSTYKLDELAEAAGVAPRTVRYYVQRGLLPAPEFHGKDTSYGEGHLLRLRAIRALQAEHLPLDTIEAELRGASPAELARLARGELRKHRTRAPEPPKPATTMPLGALWQRDELAPGLEHAVRLDAPEASLRLAAEIAARHAHPTTKD